MLHNGFRVLGLVTALSSICICVQPAHAQSFDDRRAQLAAQTELVNAEMQLQEALRRQAGTSVGSMPLVLSIFGIEGRLSARLLQSNGVVSQYREGDTIRPGLVVAAITDRAVTVRVGQGKTTRALPLDFASGAGPVVPGLPTGPGLPPGMPAANGPLPLELLPAPPAVSVTPPRRQPAAPVAAAAVPAGGSAPAQPEQARK